MHHFKGTRFNVANFEFHFTQVIQWPFGEESGLSVINQSLLLLAWMKHCDDNS